MYIAEISPARRRGGLVTLNQLMITVGILVSYITDYLLSNDSSFPDGEDVGDLPRMVARKHHGNRSANRSGQHRTNGLGHNR
jgi:hypothetical protein